MSNISFTIIDCYKRKTVLVTHSAKKAQDTLQKGYRVEVWNGQRLLQAIYKKDKKLLDAYIEFFNELSADKVRAKMKIEKNMEHLTTQQFKVLMGLVEHNDITAAMKGLSKILKRINKKVD
jgi:hypothetical protein